MKHINQPKMVVVRTWDYEYRINRLQSERMAIHFMKKSQATESHQSILCVVDIRQCR
jgi:hypothetical protein